MPVRLMSIACVLAAAACGTSQGDPRVVCVDYADRRVVKPELWDSLLMRQDPPIRAAAARAAGRTRDLRLAGVMGRALDVESLDDVRCEQLFALGQIADPASSAELLTRVNANVPMVRAAAAEALGKLMISSTVPTLVGHLTDPAPEVCGATLLALARIAGRRNPAHEPLDADSQSGLLRGATALLDDADPAVRWKAAYALAEIDCAGRVPSLRHAAESADLETRFFGVTGLARVAGSSASTGVDAVTANDFLPRLKDASPHVAAAAANGLAKVGAADVIAPLVAVVGERGASSRWHVQRAAVVALVEIVNRLGDRADEKTRRDVVAVCRKAAENPALSVASEGMKAILSLSPDKSADVLHDFEPIWGTSRSAFVRVALIRALAGGSYEQVGARLIRFANDANAQVASEALDVLAPFAKAAAEPGRRDEARLAQLAGVARKCATSSDPAIAANALQLLQICGDKSDLPLASDVAARLAGDEAAEARVDAVHVAAAIGGKEAQAMLNIARSDPSPSVRAAADQEWKRLGFTDEPPPPSRTSGPPGAESDGGGRPSSVALEPGVDFLSSKPDPRVVLHFTAGDVVIELLREQAPHHVKAILERVRAGACNGLPIHRVVTGFVVQGLDPRGDGWGTGGVFLRDEINREPYVRGSVGMPNAGPDSGGCQVFVTVVPTPHLDGRYTVFGRVVSGMDVVDALDVSNVCTKAEVIQ